MAGRTSVLGGVGYFVEEAHAVRTAAFADFRAAASVLSSAWSAVDFSVPAVFSFVSSALSGAKAVVYACLAARHVAVGGAGG